ncbi:MAG: bacterial regulatory helix-turn-helix, lysR family protein [Polaromonas sp.]|nr:bacterial regulatory helix-turn-helix, lysR family protein [Polaromonas sp.]
MTPESIKLFLQVAELESFTKAAAQRQTVQSHISKQIAELESACGARLFTRTGRGVVLTELGQHIAARLRPWLHETEQLMSDIRNTSNVPMGEVRIAILPSASHPLMTRLYQQLQAHYPLIRLNIREGQGSQLDTLLDSGSVDMAILFRHQMPNGKDERLLTVASTYLVSRPGDPLTSKPTIAFARLKGLALVLPREPAYWRAVLDETARGKGFALHAEIEADSLRTQKELVAETPDVYSLLASISISAELKTGHLQASRVVTPDLKRYVTLALSKRGRMTQAAEVVADTLQKTVQGWGYQLSP